MRNRKRLPGITDLNGSKCFITGAASGIGKATAQAAGRAGAELHLTDIDARALDTTVIALVAEGVNVASHGAVDISDFEEVKALGERVTGSHGSMDVVMNVAGISTWGEVENLEHHHWQRVVEIDLMGPIHVIEAFIPPMIEAGRGGHLVNVSSAAGLLGLPWHAPYSAAKFGLRGVSEVLRFDLERHGIGVSLVCPGAVRTPLVGTVTIAGIDKDSPEVRKFVKDFEKRAVTPEQAAEAIIDGIRKHRYLVYTSNDIRILHWVQRKFEPAYALIMRIANRRFARLARRAKPPT